MCRKRMILCGRMVCCCGTQAELGVGGMLFTDDFVGVSDSKESLYRSLYIGNCNR